MQDYNQFGAQLVLGVVSDLSTNLRFAHILSNLLMIIYLFALWLCFSNTVVLFTLVFNLHALFCMAFC